MAILFKSIEQLAKFKIESGCKDFYIDRDILSIVGIFSESNLQLATGKFNAMISMVKNPH
jgi:hypothetical protein